MKYEVDIQDIWKLCELQQYASALSKAQEYVKLVLDHFLGSAYSYLNFPHKIPLFRKHKIRFADSIKESFHLGLITAEEREKLTYLKDLRNETLHDLFLEEKFKKGIERHADEVRRAIAIAEDLFAVLNERESNLMRNAFAWDEDLELRGITDINAKFATHTPELLKKHIWGSS